MSCQANPPCRFSRVPIESVRVQWDGPAKGRKAVAFPNGSTAGRIPPRTIFLDREYWRGLDGVDARGVIFCHEWGHLCGARCEPCADLYAGRLMKELGYPGARTASAKMEQLLENRDGRSAAAAVREGFGIDDGLSAAQRTWALGVSTQVELAFPNLSPVTRGIILAQAAYESGWGTSTAASVGNLLNLTRAASDSRPVIAGKDLEYNAAGVAGPIDQRFRAYPSVYEGLRDFYYDFLGTPKYATARGLLTEGEAMPYLAELGREHFYTLPTLIYQQEFSAVAKKLQAAGIVPPFPIQPVILGSPLALFAVAAVGAALYFAAKKAGA